MTDRPNRRAFLGSAGSLAAVMALPRVQAAGTLQAPFIRRVPPAQPVAITTHHGSHDRHAAATTIVYCADVLAFVTRSFAAVTRLSAERHAIIRVAARQDRRDRAASRA